MKGKVLKLVSVLTVLCTVIGTFLPNYVKSAQAVVSNLNNTWHGIGNTGVYTVKVNGYSNLYCANGGAPLNNGTVLNDNGLSMYNASAASNVTTKPNAVSWLLDNMYLTEGVDSSAQAVMKSRLKSVIKTYSNQKDSSGKSILCSKIGVNSMDDSWINTAVDSLISDSTTLYATQQYALWHYVKNSNSAYNNAMQNSDGTYNAIPNAKSDKKYYTALYISLVGLADQAQSSGYTSANVNANSKVSFDKVGDTKVTIQSDRKTALVGPYKLTNNSSILSKSFSGTVNNTQADKIETVDASGKTVDISTKTDEFYIKYTYNKGFEKGVKYTFKTNVKATGYRTFATLLTASNANQPLISIKKEAYSIDGSAEASVEEELQGNYSVVLEKVDSKNQNTKIQGVTFKMQEGNSEAKTYGPTDSNGLVTVVNNKKITKEEVVEYTISEVNVGNNKYIKLKDQIKFYVTLSKTNNGYAASKVSFEKDKEEKTKDVTLQDNSKVKVTAGISGNTVKITIPNKSEPEGKYSLVIEKTDSTDSNVKLQGVTFKVKEGNGEAKTYGPTGSNGTVDVVKDKDVKSTGIIEYTITEVNVGNNEYIKVKDEIKVYVTISETNNVFSASKVSFENGKEIKTKQVTLEDGTTVNVTAQISGGTVIISIPNKPVRKGKYSLVLEKVDSKNLDKKISGVKFKVKEGNNEAKTYGPTGEDGTVTIAQNKEVDKAGLYSYTITEVDVGNNEYIKIKDEVKVFVKIAEVDKQLVATKVSFIQVAELTSKEVTLEDGTKVNVTAKISNGKVIITIPNKPEPKGEYSLELEKVDIEDQSKKLEGVTFEVKEGNNDARTYGPTDSNGIVSIVKNKKLTQEGTEEYTITEVDVGNNKYITLKEPVKLYIKVEKTDTAYVPSKVSFDKDQELTSKEVELKDGTKATITTSVSRNTVKVTLPNKPAVFDLALRKFITKINNQNLQNSREPVINSKDVSVISKYGTALYNNPKDPVKVKEGDTVTYKIRIYNEGNIDGYAKEITDYLPNGLEFVENSEINKANGWTATKNEDGTTIVKTKKLADTVIPASNGAEGYQKLATGANKTDENWVDFWKDVEIECKVKENVGKEQKLSNVAEITNYGYMNGDNYIIADKTGVDRDSEQDNVFGEKDKNQNSIDDYYNTQYNDKNKNNTDEKNNNNNNTDNQNSNNNDNTNDQNNNNSDNNNNNNNTDNKNDNENNNNTETQNDDKIDNYPGRQDDDDFENLIVEPDLKEFKFVLNKVDEQGNPLIGADFTVKREKDNTNEVLLNNEEVKGTYEVLENKVQFNKTYTYKVIEVESAPEYVNVMEGKYITLKVYMNEQKELVLGNYEKVEEEDYLINKYGFIINNENGTIVKENETDLYEKIKVKVNNQVAPAKVEITIPNALAPKDFDLALRKFITEIRTGVGSKQEVKQEITNRIPVFKVDEKGNYTYEHTKEPIMLINDNVVVYTLRVYNEGEVDGYAKEIKDDIPEGLEFLPQYGLNEEYRWVMLDKYGKETTEVENAVSIVSDYLSKEQEEVAGENLIKAFDTEKYKAGEIKEPYYRDVKVAFKVNTDPKSEEIIINQAQISDDSDRDGNEVEDKDSTPNKWIEGEDDQDIEKVKVQYFDLALRKWVTKAIVIEDGKQTVTETGHKAEDDPEEIVKVDLNKSKISDVTVKFGYSIRVSNEGKIAGYAKEISDYIPEGLKFVKEDNPDWEEVDGKVVTTKLENTLLQPGETAEVEIILTWINAEDNMGLKQNIAEISKDYNEYGAPDIDSTPNNQVPGEDDIDDAPVMLTVKTGQAATYAGVTIAILAILAGGLVLIKKYVIK